MFELKITNVPSERVELLESLLWDYEAQGVVEDLEYTQSYDHYDPRVVTTEYQNIKCYFEKEPSDLVQNLLESFFGNELITKHDIKITTVDVSSVDWMEKWKKEFKPLLIGNDVLIRPPWDDSAKELPYEIIINPGMGFGTGFHETTRLMIDGLKLLENKPFKSFLDVGTGSGILSFMVKKLWKEARVEATEVDENAVENFKDNSSLNGYSNQINIHHCSSLKQFDKGFDVVMANIIDGVLTHLKEDLVRLTGQYLLLSGVIDERKTTFEKDFLYQLKSLELIEVRQQGEWYSYLFKRQEGAEA